MEGESAWTGRLGIASLPTSDVYPEGERVKEACPPQWFSCCRQSEHQIKSSHTARISYHAVLQWKRSKVLRGWER
jgi:hypothetical protein